MNPVHISHRSLADEVAALLQDKILKGDYKVNQKLPVEAKLMEIYGVGRSSIREAVKILVNSGFLRVQQGKGTFIEDNTGMNEPLNQRLKHASLQNIVDVRHMLEIKVAEKAASNRTGNDISKLEHFLNKKNKAADKNALEECIEAHISFYQVLADAAKNDLMAGLFKQFLLQLKGEMLENYKDTSFFKEKRDHYQNLLDGVLRQDPKKASYWSGKITGTAV